MDLSAAKAKECIYRLRGRSVMLDFDLAELYGVPTKRLNEQVSRNLKRFPSDFMFQLTQDEVKILRSQIATLRIGGHGRFSKYLPFAFTEQGVAMLSSVLHSERAILANIAIMRAFVRFRSFLVANKGLARRLDKLEARYDAQFKEVFDAIRALMDGPDESPRRIGFQP